MREKDDELNMPGKFERDYAVQLEEIFASDNCMSLDRHSQIQLQGVFFFKSLWHINTRIFIDVESDFLSFMKGVFIIHFKVKNITFVSFKRKFPDLLSGT